MTTTETAARVASRYIEKTSAKAGVYSLLSLVLNQLGGAAWLVKFFKAHVDDYDEYDDTGTLTQWDRDLFYRKGGAETLLDQMFQRTPRLALDVRLSQSSCT